VSSVAFYAGVTLIGTATTSPFSVTWSPTPGTYTLKAVATDNLGATTTSSTISVIVNSAPTVNITVPANGASLQTGMPTTITATASDSDGSVASVAFLVNNTTIATVTASPYTTPWTPGPAGSYTLKAIATDDRGATTSASITVTVTPNSPPTVSISAPANNAIITAPATVTVSATANDSDGSVSSVAFYAGVTLIG